MTVREGNIGMNVQIKTDFLYVASEPDINLIELPHKIIQLITNQKNDQMRI